MSEHILVINTSPRAQRGTTGIVINQFLKGCHEMGATSEIIEVARSELHTCTGEFPGIETNEHICQVHEQDQADEFAKKWARADRIVLASPLHFNTVTAHLIRFLERLMCSSDTRYTGNSGRTLQQNTTASTRPSVVIGVCAYPGVSNFDLFREVMLNYQNVFELEPAGSLLVPMSRDLTVLNATNPRYSALQRVMAAITQAGWEFMTHGAIGMDTQETVSMDTDELSRLHAEFDGYFHKLNNVPPPLAWNTTSKPPRFMDEHRCTRPNPGMTTL